MKKAVLTYLLFILISMFAISNGMAMTLYGGVQYEIEDGNGKLSLYYNGPGGAVTLLTQLGETPITVVGGYCFIMNANSVTQLTIPNGYTTVEDYAFHLGTSLLRVEIADSVTYLGAYAFDNCSKLEEAVLPSTLTVLNDGLFNGCKALGTVQIPSGVTRIGDSVFSGCSSLNNLTIPQGVTSVGASAFQGCSSLTQVRLPGGVTTIQAGTFSNCGALSDIRFSNNLTAIGDSAFEKCTSLTEMTIPNTVTSIGSKAFSGCTGLGSIRIPNGVRSVGAKAFENCPAQIYAEIGSDGAKALGKAGYSFRATGLAYDLKYVYDGDTLLGLEILNVPKDVTSFSLPASVTRIGKDAFRNCASLTQVNLHEALNYIGANAFTGCESLTSVTVPNSVTGIDKSAFSSCGAQLIASTGKNSANALGKAGYSYHDSQLDADLQYVYTNNECTELRLLSVNKTLTSFTIPVGVTTISKAAFENCVDLAVVTIPDSVNSIGMYAFQGCGNLLEVSIPEGVTTLREYTFDGCTSLMKVTLPNSLTSIGFTAFIGCGVPSIDIPNGVTYVNGSAFQSCPAVKYAARDSEAAKALSKAGYSFRVKGEPFDLKYLFTGDEVSGLSLVSADTDITSLRIPDGITAIGGSAFKNCTVLAEVTIPASVNSIGSYAFQGCGNLLEVSIPEGVTTLRGNTFSGCTSLTKVTLPSTLTAIELRAFEYCSFPSIDIPDGVTYIHHTAFTSNFDNNPTVKYATLGSEAAKALSKAGYSFRVKGDSYELKYLFTDDEVSGLTLVSADKNITSLQIPAGVTEIGNYAFTDCVVLTVVSIPGSVANIGNRAFSGCAKLSKVLFYGETTSFGSSVFSYPYPTIYCYEYSDADAWATEQEYNVVYLDNVNMEDLLTLTLQDDFCLICGQSTAIGINIFPDGEHPAVTWVSSAPKIVSVNNGVVTAIAPGNTTITATVGNKSASCKVSVICEQILPANLKEIEEEAFAGAGFEAVIIPDGCTAIGSRAFADCKNLIYVRIPASVTDIAEDAFEGCPAQLVIDKAQ